MFAFGEGVALPARVKLKQLPAHLLPTSSHNRILIKASFKKPLAAAQGVGG